MKRCGSPLILGFAWAIVAPAADWPQYRADGARSGHTCEPLARELGLSWTYRCRHAPMPAWPTRNRQRFDVACQPVVADGRLFFCSSADGKVYALNAATGQVCWEFFTDGPIRFAPSCWRDRVLVAGDDGCLYALAAADGRLLWQIRCSPKAFTGCAPRRSTTAARCGNTRFRACCWRTTASTASAPPGPGATTAWAQTGSMCTRKTAAWAWTPEPGASWLNSAHPRVPTANRTLGATSPGPTAPCSAPSPTRTIWSTAGRRGGIRAASSSSRRSCLPWIRAPAACSGHTARRIRSAITPSPSARDACTSSIGRRPPSKTAAIRPRSFTPRPAAGPRETSATPGYIDLTRGQETENYGGIRPGCWINVIPAGGLVLLADAASWCTCSYLNQATVALQPPAGDRSQGIR